MCFSPSSNSSRHLLSLQETHITHTLTALHNMSKIQCRQLKSVKIPWDKQGFLKKKKKKSIYTHHSDYHLELQGILPSLFWKLHKYIAGSRPHILAIWTDLRGILTSQWCNCTWWAEYAQGEMQACPPHSYRKADYEFKECNIVSATYRFPGFPKLPSWKNW